MFSAGIFREYDIRGIAGSDLTEEAASAIGCAYAGLLRKTFPRAERVSIGRDVRHSSEGLATALIRGITSAGLDVYDLGVCPTPVQYFSLYHLDVQGGIMVTGSHNPPEYNGFKVSVGRETIHGNGILELRDAAMQGLESSPTACGTLPGFSSLWSVDLGT